MSSCLTCIELLTRRIYLHRILAKKFKNCNSIYLQNINECHANISVEGPPQCPHTQPFICSGLKLNKMFNITVTVLDGSVSSQTEYAVCELNVKNIQHEREGMWC